jgi:hypothetical protein
MEAYEVASCFSYASGKWTWSKIALTCHGANGSSKTAI